MNQGVAFTLVVFLIIVVACIYSWIFRRAEEEERKIEVERKRKAQEAEMQRRKEEDESKRAALAASKEQLQYQISELDGLIIADLFEAYFWDYVDQLIENMGDTKLIVADFNEDAVRLDFYDLFNNADLVKSALSVIRDTLSKTWSPCKMESLKDRLIEVVDHLLAPTTLKDLIVQEMVNTTQDTILTKLELLANEVSNQSAEELAKYKAEHPEAYQLARQTEAIEKQTYALNMQTTKLESAADNVKRSLHRIEVEQKQLSDAASATATGMSIMMLQNSFRR